MNSNTAAATEAAPVSSRRAARDRRNLRRKRYDMIANRAVSLGGWIILAAIASIVFLMVREVVPLFRAPVIKSELRGLDLPGRGTLLAASAGEDTIYLMNADGSLHFLTRTGDLLGTENVAALKGAAALSCSGSDQCYVLDGKGRVHGLAIVSGRPVAAASEQFERTVRVRENLFTLLPAGHERATPVDMAVQSDGGNTTVALVLSDGSVAATARREATGANSAAAAETRLQLLSVMGEKATRVAVSPGGSTVVVGTEAGNLHYWVVSDGSLRYRGSTGGAGSKAAVTAMAYLLGGQTLAVGRANGDVDLYLPVRAAGAESERSLQLVRSFAGQGAAVTGIRPSERDRQFIVADEAGNVRLLHSTAHREAARWRVNGAPVALAFAPKANSALIVTADNQLHSWSISNPHPEVSFRALFGKVWYEGYDRPAWVWQSSGATDADEAKLSLVPLVFGTVKGAFYAALLAFPIAIMAAIYSSQFMSAGLRAAIKPAIEMMAALPSVVLGFLAGLWLAPQIAENVLGFLLIVIIMPLGVFLAYTAWQLIPHSVRSRCPAWAQIAVSLGAVMLSIVTAFYLGVVLQAAVFGGDFTFWLFTRLGIRYEMRNALIAGLAMGFAIVPVVYTIAEDALSSVPRSLVAGSLALGATRWQTVRHVVVPTALPGIFAASMVGLGRAVGETMIVLMASGNTPILSLLPFDGFRTLSASIAVEMPEAPVGGTLYRVLFLSALLLFALTFFANTAAELVRLRMRRRVSQL